MTITFFCPHCSKRFSLDESVAGRRARCKQCQHEFIIPGAGPSGSTPARVRTPGPPEARKTSPISSPRPRPAPGREAIVPEGSPVVDPYGLDEDILEPVLHPYVAAVDDNEFLPRRPGKPVTSSMRRSKTRGDDLEWVGMLTRIGLVVGAILFLLTAAFAFTPVPVVSIVAISLLVFLCFAMLLVGYVISLIVPFLEDVTQGLLYLFVPFYNIYYTITRWESMRRPIYLSMSGVILIFASGFLASIVLPAVAGSRKGAPVQQVGGGVAEGFDEPAPVPERPEGRVDRPTIGPRFRRNVPPRFVPPRLRH